MPEISRTFQMVNGKAVPLPAGGGADPGIAARVKALEDRFDPEGKPIALNLATRDTPGIVRIGAGLNITPAAPDDADPEDVAGQDAGISLASDADASEAASEISPETDREEGDTPEPGGEETPGVLSLAPHASADADAYGRGSSTDYGHVRVVDNFEEELSAADGVALSPKGVKRAWDRLFGVMEGQTFTTSGTWTVPETGQYTVTCVGGGGNGGSGGSSRLQSRNASGGYNDSQWGTTCCARTCGGGGGGGGAGQVVSRKLTLTRGDVIAFTVGGPGGATTFQDITALAGGAGASGGSGSGAASPSESGCSGAVSGGAGGGAGISYGSTSTNGAAGGASTSAFFGPISAYSAGGAGGIGGISTQSPYGDGGAGGRGADTGSATNKYNINLTWSGSAGSAGKQGCIIIESPISAA